MYVQLSVGVFGGKIQHTTMRDPKKKFSRIFFSCALATKNPKNRWLSDN